MAEPVEHYDGTASPAVARMRGEGEIPGAGLEEKLRNATKETGRLRAEGELVNPPDWSDRSAPAQRDGRDLSRFAHDRDVSPSFADQRDDIKPMEINPAQRGKLEEMSWHKGVKQASEWMSDYRKVREPSPLFAQEVNGLSADQVRQHMSDPALARANSLTKNQAREFEQQGIAPPTKVGQVDRDWNVLKPLADDEAPEWRDQVPRSVKEATRNLARWKELRAANDAILQQEFDRQAQERALTEQQAPDAAQTAPASAPQPQARPSQPDLYEQTRQAELNRIAAERHHAELLRQHAQMTAEERATLAELDRINTRAAQENLPQNDRQLDALRALAERGSLDAQKKLSQFAEYVQALMPLGEKYEQQNRTRVNNQIALEQRQTAARQQAQAQWNKSQDDAFHAQAARTPGLANANFKAVQQEARTMLFEAYAASAPPGTTPDQIQAAVYRDWNAGRYRSTHEQLIIAQAAAARLAQRGLAAKQYRGDPSPSLRPGVRTAAASEGRADSGDADEIRSLQRQLQVATGRKALELSAKLSKAMRGAGRLANAN